MQQLYRTSFPLSSGQRSIRIWGIIIATLLTGLVIACLPAIPQATHFHDFADQRSWWGLPNLLNVVSNVAFVLGGMAGIVFLWRCADSSFPKALWGVFFAGALLTGIGSEYYHYAPDNARLVWDRLPMTLVFMSLLAALIAERISTKGGQILLVPLLLLGVGSVLYWHFTEQVGQGDLRLYGFLQFYPVLLIPALLRLFPARFTHSYYLMGMIGLYALAKISEHFDGELLVVGHLLSGHTVKHLLASLPIWFALRMLRTRRAVK